MHVGSGSLFMIVHGGDCPDERSRTTATRRSVIYRNVWTVWTSSAARGD